MEKTRKDIKSFQNVFDALRHISESQPRFLSLTVWGQQTLGENQAVSTGKNFYFCLLKCFSYNNSAYLGMAQRHTLAWERKPRTIIGMPAEGMRKFKKIDLKNIDKIVNWNTMQKTRGVQSCTMSLCTCQTHPCKSTLHNTNRSETAGPSISHIRTLPSSLQHPLAHALPRQGDHLYTQKRITCTQGSLVHIEPHLYTYRNKNLKSLVHTQNHNHHTSTTHTNV